MDIAKEISEATISKTIFLPNCDCEYASPVPTDDGREKCYYCGTIGDSYTYEEADDEIERSDRLILAAEKWSKQYERDPNGLSELIKIEAKMDRLLRVYFREVAERAISCVRWFNYEVKLREIHGEDAFSVEVLIDDGPLGQEDSIVMQTMLDPELIAIALGAQSGELVYNTELGLSETSLSVQNAAREAVAELVGKKVDSNGNIVDNPRAKYQITETTRKQIRESIRTSLSIGETQPDATARLRQVIANPKRAATIARTEAVNAYQKGLLVMAKESNALGKVWLTTNTTDVCAQYASVGAVKLNYQYAIGIKAPAAHPNCRCSLRLIYPGDPMENDIAGKTKILVQSEGASDLTVAYHGSGHNLANGNYAFGDAFYVTRDSDTAETFGKVKKLDINIPSSKILYISDHDEYVDLISKSLLANPGKNFNDVLPAFIKSKGYSAVEMSKELDPLGGIAIVDQKLYPKT